MDRLNKVHRAARVQLPKSVIDFDDAGSVVARLPPKLPILPRYVGIIGFVAGGAAVVFAATLLALSI